VLIEKDWVSFGHKFEERSGFFKGHSDEAKERSPVFINFCDCLFQLINQFPTAFEYNETFLLFLCHHLYTCKFGTFLFNNERDREFTEIRSKTVSIWTFINRHLKDTTAPSTSPHLHFQNPFYKRVSGRIEPNTSLAYFKIWVGHFLLYKHPHPHITHQSKSQSIITHYQNQ